MAVAERLLGAEFSQEVSQEPAFPVGVNPQTVALLVNASRFGVIDRLTPQDRLLLERYFHTQASLKDLEIASGLSEVSVYKRLRRGLGILAANLSDDFGLIIPNEAISLKARNRRKKSTDLSVLREPFPIEMRYASEQTVIKLKAAFRARSEKPAQYKKPSQVIIEEYFLREQNSYSRAELSVLEKRILSLLGKGLKHAAIAERVRRPRSTVRHILGKGGPIQEKLGTSSSHESLFAAIDMGLISFNNFNINFEAVDSLSPAEVEKLIEQTLKSSGGKIQEISNGIGVNSRQYRLSVLSAYSKLGITSRMEATAYVLTFIRGAIARGRYTKEQVLENHQKLEGYSEEALPVDIRFAIEQLDNIGLDYSDKKAFLAYYIWSNNKRGLSFAAKVLNLSSIAAAKSLVMHALEEKGKYTLPVFEIYEEIFTPIDLARDIFYNLAGEKTLERFAALSDIVGERSKDSNKRTMTKATKQRINKEAEAKIK